MNSKLSNEIKAEALRLGFFACGIAKAEPVDNINAEHLNLWLGRGKHADMGYMKNYTEKRLNPLLLMEGVKSIISVALNYAPAKRIPEDEYQLAVYAYGMDYHDIMKKKLNSLAYKLGFVNALSHDEQKTDAYDKDKIRCRIFCDTAPVLERYWAVKAGLGWIGRNHQLIIPNAGSMFYLGELFVDIELDYDTPQKNRCGNCRRCIDACPSGALSDKQNTFDASLCLSYQTIENKGELSDIAKREIDNSIYGCDKCLAACPWNNKAIPNREPELQPKEELLNMTKEKWHNLTEDEYRSLFKGSAVKRVKYNGLMRNIKAVNENKEQ